MKGFVANWPNRTFHLRLRSLLVLNQSHDICRRNESRSVRDRHAPRMPITSNQHRSRCFDRPRPRRPGILADSPRLPARDRSEYGSKAFRPKTSKTWFHGSRAELPRRIVERLEPYPPVARRVKCWPFSETESLRHELLAHRQVESFPSDLRLRSKLEPAYKTSDR